MTSGLYKMFVYIEKYEIQNEVHNKFFQFLESIQSVGTLNWTERSRGQPSPLEWRMEYMSLKAKCNSEVRSGTNTCHFITLSTLPHYVKSWVYDIVSCILPKGSHSYIAAVGESL